MKMRRIHAVLAVFETGSALAAAEVAHMSQPAVAAAVMACEKDVGALLFQRTSRGMSPTEVGHIFATRAEAAMAHLRTAEAVVRQKRGRHAPVLHRLISEVQLRALFSVIETGGFSAAARQLQLSQPSVYRAAKELEDLCGLPLWTRRGAHVEPTPEARELARLGRLCFAEIDSALTEIRELQGVMDGSLNIGALPLARSQWLPDALARTLALYPQARIRIMDGPYDAQLNALRHARLDVILGALRDPLPAEDVEQQAIFDDPLVILVRKDHPLTCGFDSELDKLTPTQLGALSWILPRDGTPGRRVFETFLAAQGLAPPARVIECSSVVATRALLLATDHAAVLSRRQVEPEITAGVLKVMGPPLDGSLRTIGIATRRGFRPTRLQDALLSQLRAVAAHDGARLAAPIYQTMTAAAASPAAPATELDQRAPK